MSEDKKSSLSSRREFLKGICRTTAYVLPLVTALKLTSVKAWAASYGRTAENSPRRTHNGFFDQLSRFFSHLFHS